MISLYLFSCIPAVIWIFLYFHSKQINLWEAGASLGISLALAGITHFCSFKSQTGDVETWSGQVTGVRCFSSWVERYQEAVYKDESYTTRENGKSVRKTRRVFSHYEWRTSFHPRHNTAYSNIGEYSISDQKYNELIREFGKEKSVQGQRSTSNRGSHMISGDRNDYISVNENNPIIPVTKNKSFVNRLKAGSIWDKKQPPEKLNIPARPSNNDPFRSDRLIGTAKNHFKIRELDELNAVLGPVKGIDINIVGFDTGNSQYGQYVESKWLGGNKNSLTICYGFPKEESNHTPAWVYCFGWSDSDICKRNIEGLFLTNKFANHNSALLQSIKKEIMDNYQKPEWKKFDYIQIEPGGWAWFWFILALALCQTGFAWWAVQNQYTKV